MFVVRVFFFTITGFDAHDLTDARSPRQVSGTYPTSPDGTMEDVGPSTVSASASAAAPALPALPEDGDLPNDLPVAEVQKEEDTGPQMAS